MQAYTTGADLSVHLESKHFQAWQTATESMLSGAIVKTDMTMLC